MSKAGWVFRLEVVTNKPSILKKDMMFRIEQLILHMDDIDAVKIEELYESLKLFAKKEKKKPS